MPFCPFRSPQFLSTNPKLIFCVVAFLLFPPIASGQAGHRLDQGQQLAKEISGGKKDSFIVAVPAGSLAMLKAVQQGIDVTSRVFSSDGKLVYEFDSQPRANGEEAIEIAAEQDATFRIDIEPKFKDAKAGRYELGWKETRALTAADRAVASARANITASRELDRSGKYRPAIAKAGAAVETLSATLGPAHRDVAMMLNRIGILYFQLGDNPTSENYIRRALSIFESQPTPDPLLIADPINNLGVIARLRGDYVDAEKLFLRVLSMREAELGPDHPAIGSQLNNLAILYRNRGDYARAEATYLRTLEIRERAVGKDGVELATPLNNLAALYYYKGDFDSALAIDRRVIAIREKAMPPDHPEIAHAYSNISTVLADVGQTDEAIRYLQRAIDIFKKHDVKEPTGYSRALYNLANVRRDLGDLVTAKSLYISALQIGETVAKQEPQRLANYLSGYGTLLIRAGEYAEAESVLKRSLEIRERNFGPDHTDVAAICDALALMYLLRGDTVSAVRFQARANAINEAALARNITHGTEHQRMAYTKLISEGLNQTIALHIEKAQSDNTARDLALTAILQRKGRVLDALTDSISALRRRTDASTRLLLDRVNDANARLSEISLSGPRGGDTAAYRNQLDAIQERKEMLDKEISQRSRGFYAPVDAVSVQQVAAALPKSAALIEFVLYRPVTGHTGASRPMPKYAAYVLTATGEIGSALIGDAAEVDELVARLRSALRDPRRPDHRSTGAQLFKRLLEPLAPHISTASHFLIAPDGALNLIPFESLIDSAGKFLVESRDITYLASGRELLRMGVKRKNRSGPMLFADPSFGSPPPDNLIASRTGTAPRRFTRETLSDTYFAPLSGTGAEARSIHKLFPSAVVLSGQTASESVLKKAAAPEVLHIATHGFFLDLPTKTGVQPPGTLPFATGESQNPLLRSGLAFAGANARSDGKDDGILTALEASGLDLWGTKLVVLSACDTGVGEVKNGEGVYGLRRSFALAGAESIVMSLWPVSDYVTRQTMIDYYRNLKDGRGRGRSLRNVQLEMMQRPGRGHPFYWASFIQSGEWANLAGTR